MSAYERTTGWFRNFRGVIAASVTPFDDDGSVSHPRIPRLVDFLIDRGVDGIMVGGTTGEFVTMSVPERINALAAFTDACAGRVPIVAHVGAPDSRAALAMTEAATDIGVAAVAAMTPQFFPTTDAAVAQYFAEIAEAAPQLPVLVYEFPSRAGNSTGPDVFGQLLDLPNLAGIKVSADRLEDVTVFLPFEPEVVVICGNDYLQADFVARGGRAVVSGNAAVYPEVSTAVFASLVSGAQGDRERRVLGELAVLSRAGAPDRLKQLLQARGVDAGAARCRTHLPSDLADESGILLSAEITSMLTDVNGEQR